MAKFNFTTFLDDKAKVTTNDGHVIKGRPMKISPSAWDKVIAKLNEQVADEPTPECPGEDCARL